MFSLGSAFAIILWLAIGAGVGYWLATRGRTSDTRLAMDAARRRHLEEVFGELRNISASSPAKLLLHLAESSMR